MDRSPSLEVVANMSDDELYADEVAELMKNQAAMMYDEQEFDEEDLTSIIRDIDEASDDDRREKMRQRLIDREMARLREMARMTVVPAMKRWNGDRVQFHARCDEFLDLVNDEELLLDFCMKGVRSVFDDVSSKIDSNE
jgi:hypothetical protein